MFASSRIVLPSFRGTPVLTRALLATTSSALAPRSKRHAAAVAAAAAAATKGAQASSPSHSSSMKTGRRKVTAAPVYEDVFAVSAAKALDSVLHPAPDAGLAESSFPEEESSAMTGATDVESCTDATVLNAESEPLDVSLGEEELCDGKETFANDMEDPLEAMPSSGTGADVAKAPPLKDAPHEETDATSQELKPQTLRGDLFPSTIESMLIASAARQGFTSPVWSSKIGYEALNIHLLEGVTPDTGVHVHSSAIDMILYNLAQTDCAVAAGMENELQALKQHKASAERTNEALIPHDLSGRRIFGYVAAQLQTHKDFRELQTKSSIWLSLSDVRTLQATVKPSERKNYLAIPNRFASSGDIQSPQRRAFLEELTVLLGDDVDVDISTHSVHFNSSQLEDSERFSEAACTPIQCFSIKGRRYSAATAFLMREYCLANGFRASGEAVFMTRRNIESMGSSIVQRLNEKGEEVQPYITSFSGDLVALYNAEHTDMYDVMIEMMHQKKVERKDYIAASHNTTTTL